MSEWYGSWYCWSFDVALTEWIDEAMFLYTVKK